MNEISGLRVKASPIGPNLGYTFDDARQMYTRVSVLGKARNRNSEISPTPPLIFTGGQKVLNLSLIHI